LRHRFVADATKIFSSRKKKLKEERYDVDGVSTFANDDTT